MAIAYLQFPPQYSAAFNPIIMVVQTPKARYVQLEKDLAATSDPDERAKIQDEMNDLEKDKDQDWLDPIPVVLIIGNNADNRSVTIEREPDAEGKAEIDLSYLARYAFINKKRRVYTTIVDYNLGGRISIENTDRTEQVWSGYLLNAVQQLGYYDDQGLQEVRFSTTRKKAIKYPGYDLQIATLYPKSGSPGYALMNGGGGSVYSLPTFVSVINIGEDRYDRVVIHARASLDSEILATLPIEAGCVPSVPFYVRWINSLGGWDYQMFECNEQIMEVTDFENIQKVPTDIHDTQQTLDATVTETVTAGLGGLTREDYDTLVALPRSPHIEWYDEMRSSWQTILLSEDFSAVWNSRNAFGQVEFTFLKPRILTQF